MAKPRVFISSTYYDLKYVRDDLERFITELGYEPIRHETGSIAYSKGESLDKSAYREVSQSDIIVCIVGGRYGTEASEGEASITQKELLTALELGIQVYVFVEQNVYTEYSTYLRNKDVAGVKFSFVDNVKVYEFIERIYALPYNNPIAAFTGSDDITSFLKNQWSGLFKRFLQEERRTQEVKVLHEMKSITSTLQQLVDYLSHSGEKKDQVIKDLLLSNHPAFRTFASILNVKYRVYFTNKDELDSWLDARSYRSVSLDALDLDSISEWFNDKKQQYVKLWKQIFDDDGKLLPVTEAEWNEGYVTLEDYSPAVASDDTPF